jgi:uncharacterized Fe-S cluster protein YjdI/CDGSH-type Zn-finger protein
VEKLMQPEPYSDSVPSGKAYLADDITVYYDGKRCRHFAECLRGLPAVFDGRAKPWIQPANADPETVAEVVRRCPTGALHYAMRDGPAEQPDSPTTITVRADGPMILRGDLVFEGPAGPMRETRAALCGCAKTANAPFCDGTCGCKP